MREPSAFRATCSRASQGAKEGGGLVAVMLGQCQLLVPEAVCVSCHLQLGNMGKEGCIRSREFVAEF